MWRTRDDIAVTSLVGESDTARGLAGRLIVTYACGLVTL